MSILRTAATAAVTAATAVAQQPGACLRELAAGAVAVATWPLGLSDGPLSLALAGARRDEGVAPVETPVVLVHGFAGSKSNFLAVETRLRRAGFEHVVRFTYDAFTQDVPEVAQDLADCITEVLARTGAERVHLVGHSLGGVVCRWYVTELGGDEVVDLVVTIASPHDGSPLGHLGALRPRDLGRCVSQIATGSALLASLDARLTARHAAGERVDCRWVAFACDLDVVVPPTRAELHHDALDVTNVLVEGRGHLSVLLAPELAEALTCHLLAAETATPYAPAVAA